MPRREDEIDPAALWRHAEAIAQWPREAGSEGEARAFAYLAEQLERAGVAVRRERSPALVSLPRRASLVVDGRTCAAITHAMAASTAAAGVEAPLVPATRIADREWAGRIVAFEGIARAAHVERAERAGALGVLFLDVGCVAHEMIVSSLWGSPSSDDAAPLPALPVVTAGGSDATLLSELLAGPRAPRARLSAQVETAWREIPQLVAEVRAPRAQDGQLVLLSGHVDSWHLGAMDNGGANAVMLELARVLQQRRERLRRHVRIAFWSGHSQGRYAGSASYVDAHWSELERRCIVHVNVDSVGARGAGVLAHAPSTADAHALGAEAVRRVTGQRLEHVRFARAGDQSLMNIGVAALFMTLSEQPADGEHGLTGAGRPLAHGEAAATGGLGWWWHTPADTLDKLDPDLLARDAAVYLHVVEAFATEPVVPLDVHAAAAQVHDRLGVLAERCAGRFDLAEPLAQSEAVVALARAAMEQAERVRRRLDDEQAVLRLNRALLAAARPLTRLEHVEGDRFAHDATTSRPPLPLLAPLATLLALAPGDEREHPLRIALTRRRNRVLHELRVATDALTAAAPAGATGAAGGATAGDEEAARA